jgi:hypothetical protein
VTATHLDLVPPLEVRLAVSHLLGWRLGMRSRRLELFVPTSAPEVWRRAAEAEVVHGLHRALELPCSVLVRSDDTFLALLLWLPGHPGVSRALLELVHSLDRLGRSLLPPGSLSELAAELEPSPYLPKEEQPS